MSDNDKIDKIYKATLCLTQLCEDVKKHDETLYGNGKMGLVTTVAIHKWAIWVGGIAIGFLFSKVF